jgi:hypothetical protein
MPLVIPKSGAIQYVQHEDVLAEILGHSNFDGENWAIGDRLIFEDGTEARIKLVPGDQGHTWDDPILAHFDEVKRAAGLPNATNWAELFSTFEEQSKRSGCFSPAWTLSTICAVATILVRLAAN